MGFIFNFGNLKKKKKKINPFDLVEDFDYDFAESFEMDDYGLDDDFDEYDESNFYRGED